MRLRLTIVAASLVGTVPAAAATVVINHVYDPSNTTSFNFSGEALAAPITLGVGDELDLTLTLTGGARLSTLFESGIYLALVANSAAGDVLTGDGRLEFINPVGDFRAGPYELLGYGFGSNTAGIYVKRDVYRSSDNPISFSGFHLHYSITGSQAQIIRTYDAVTLTDLSGANPFLVAPAAVPDAPTWTLLIAGFGVVGHMIRRRRVAKSFKASNCPPAGPGNKLA